MKKNAIYLLVLVVLSVGVFFILKQQAQEKVTPGDRDFAVENIDTIDRIVLTDKNRKADLTREGDHWMINGKYKAMPSKVDVLLKTIKDIRVDSPVGKAAEKNAAKELEAKAVKVELFHKGESQPFKVYEVGGATQDSKGTFMRMERNGRPAEKIYVIGIPSFTGMLGVRYFTEEMEWRDTGIFDYNMDDIAEVSMQYHNTPQHSFTIKAVNQDSFTVQPTIASANPRGKVSKEGVAKFLSSFDFLNAEAYDNEYAKKDSVLGSAPFVSVTVTDKKGASKQMTVYYMPLNRRSKTQFDLKGDQLKYDLDKYYAVINEGKDFVTIQTYVFGKIFRKYSDFFVPPAKT